MWSQSLWPGYLWCSEYLFIITKKFQIYQNGIKRNCDHFDVDSSDDQIQGLKFGFKISEIEKVPKKMSCATHVKKYGILIK